MKFHPKKCKVVPVAPPGKGLKDLFNKIFPLRKMFFYKPDDGTLNRAFFAIFVINRTIQYVSIFILTI